MEVQVLGYSCLVPASLKLCLGVSIFPTHPGVDHTLTCMPRFSILVGSLPCPPVHSRSFRGRCLHLCSWSHVKCCITSTEFTHRAPADHCVQGLLQISMPFILYWLNYYPVQRKLTLWAGCILCFLSALGGAFATTVRLLPRPLHKMPLTSFNSHSN